MKKRDIRTKRVYEPVAKADGTRVLVERLWPRGVKKEDAALDLWLKEIAPSPELRAWLKKHPDDWAEFKRRYRAELEANDEAVEELLAAGPPSRRLTLVYAKADMERNSAVILKEFLDERLGG